MLTTISHSSILVYRGDANVPQYLLFYSHKENNEPDK